MAAPAFPLPTSAEALELALLLFGEATAVALLAGVLLRLAKQRSAALRAAVGSAATLALLVLPLAQRVAPHWEVPWTGGVAERIVGVSTGPVASSAQRGARQPPALSPVPQPREEPGWTGAEIAQTAPGAGWAWLLPALFLYGWTAGVLMVAFGLVGDEIRRRRLLRGSTPPPPWVADRAEAVGSAVLRRPLRVRMVQGLPSPAATGVWRPTLLLPEEAARWNGARLDAVLHHEVAHLERGDILDHQLGRVAQMLYWPNPLVHGLVRRARAERERACDDRALSQGLAPDHYAQVLLDLVERARGARPVRSVVAMARGRRSPLSERLLAVLDELRDRRPVRRSTVAALTLAFGGLGIVLGGARALAAGRVLPGDVLRALSAVDPAARARAVARLGGFCGPQAQRYAVELLTDSEPAVREAAVGALSDLGSPAALAASFVALRAEVDARARRGMTRALARSRSDQAEAVLMWATHEADPGTRAEAVEALRLRGRLRPATLKELAELQVSDPVAAIRVAALRAIGWSGLERVPQALQRAVSDPDPAVRTAAVELAAEHVDRSAAREALGCLAQDRDPGVRRQAKAVLGGI